MAWMITLEFCTLRIANDCYNFYQNWRNLQQCDYDPRFSNDFVMPYTMGFWANLWIPWLSANFDLLLPFLNLLSGHFLHVSFLYTC